jgi:hypothetical protein
MSIHVIGVIGLGGRPMAGALAPIVTCLVFILPFS